MSSAPGRVSGHRRAIRSAAQLLGRPALVPMTLRLPSFGLVDPVRRFPALSRIPATTKASFAFKAPCAGPALEHVPATGPLDAQARAPGGLLGRLRHLTKAYGSATLVVYAIVGAFDFGLSFLMIYLVGAEHVRKAEDWVLELLNWRRAPHDPAASQSNSSQAALEADSGTKAEHTLWTTAVVAYTVHKTLLLPVRLALTAWITPPIVRYLTLRGWKIGSKRA